MEKELDYEILKDVEDEQINFTFKIIIIGESGVGKSCLALRGTEDKFHDFYLPTIGFDFFKITLKISDQIIKLEIWDTCGQEVYRSLISSYYRNSVLAIIVYSIDDKNSFEKIEEWLCEIKAYTYENIKIFLIGNKVDLEERRVIKKETAEKLVENQNIDFFLETSAKKGLNARKVFIKAAQMLLEECKNMQFSSMTDEKSSKTVSSKEIEKVNEKDSEDKKRKKKCCD